MDALVARRRVRLVVGRRRAARRARPGRRRRRLGGRGRHDPRAHQPRSSPARSDGDAGGSPTSGIGEGDRVGILLPMLPETVIAVLALGRLGAIYTPIFSGYGAPAIASRPRRLRGEAADHRRRLPAARRRGSTSRRSPTPRSPRRRRSSACSSSARPAATCGCRGPTAATSGGPRRRGRGRRDVLARLDAGGHRPRDAVHAHLHVGHDRPAQGRGPRPRRLPDQGARRTSPTASTCRAATRSSGSPTSAG